MDQIRIGMFISEKRKEQNLTQRQLAERLGITDRAVSKWERGKSLPDASSMLELCAVLGITVNDLLSGEVVSMNSYNENIEKNLLEMVKQKEQSDRRLLKTEIVIGVLSTVFLFAMISIGAVFMMMQEKIWVFFLLFGIGLLQLIVCTMFCLRIEQVAGYYACRKCGYRYVPTYGSVNGAMHMGRTRYMKCPQCGKRSWQKKVISAEDK
ncbi:MAG: helix-turn-helix transcriptional regulator [Oscillospiraceae bacterium]|nr:helix-turn-helix transcriptional regulator [Oscillospiraceae bacterium]